MATLAGNITQCVTCVDAYVNKFMRVHRNRHKIIMFVCNVTVVCTGHENTGLRA